MPINSGVHVACRTAIVAALLAPTGALAQQAPVSNAPVGAEALEEVVITAIIDSAKRAADQQKNASGVTNVVAADAIGRFPDPNIAEALQRVVGVASDRGGKGPLMQQFEPFLFGQQQILQRRFGLEASRVGDPFGRCTILGEEQRQGVVKRRLGRRGQRGQCLRALHIGLPAARKGPGGPAIKGAVQSGHAVGGQNRRVGAARHVNRAPDPGPRALQLTSNALQLTQRTSTTINTR